MKILSSENFWWHMKYHSLLRCIYSYTCHLLTVLITIIICWRSNDKILPFAGRDLICMQTIPLLNQENLEIQSLFYIVCLTLLPISRKWFTASQGHQQLQSFPQSPCAIREQECCLLGWAASTAIQRPTLHQHHRSKHCPWHRAAVPRLPKVPRPLPSQRVGDRRRSGDAGLRSRTCTWCGSDQLHQVTVQPVSEWHQVLWCWDREWGRLGGRCPQHELGFRWLLPCSPWLQLGSFSSSLQSTDSFVGRHCMFADDLRDLIILQRVYLTFDVILFWIVHIWIELCLIDNLLVFAMRIWIGTYSFDCFFLNLWLQYIMVLTQCVQKKCMHLNVFGYLGWQLAAGVYSACDHWRTNAVEQWLACFVDVLIKANKFLYWYCSFFNFFALDRIQFTQN